MLAVETRATVMAAAEAAAWTRAAVVREEVTSAPVGQQDEVGVQVQAWLAHLHLHLKRTEEESNRPPAEAS